MFSIVWQSLLIKLFYLAVFCLSTDSNYDRLSASGTLKSLRRNSPSVSRLERTADMPENSHHHQHHPPSSSSTSSQHPLSASSRIASFFAKRSFRAPNPLKRTKSVTKLDRKSMNGLDQTDLMESAPEEDLAGSSASWSGFPIARVDCRGV